MLARDVLEAFRHLPVVTLDALVRGPFVVLAPHPDDESLGCGGLIAQASGRGIAAHVAVLTDGAMSHPRSRRFPAPALRALRAAEARRAVATLGVLPERLHFLGAPDADAPHGGQRFDALVDSVSGLIRGARAEAVFATWRHDPHGDHVAAHAIAEAAARRCAVALWSYPVWGWTLDTQDVTGADGVRLDVGAQQPAKRRAIAAHRSQTTGLIDDDPDGFVMASQFRALFEGRYEVFLRD